MNNHISEYKHSKDVYPMNTTINNFLGKMSDDDSPVLFYREKLKAFGKDHHQTVKAKMGLPCAIFSGTFTGGKKLENFNVDTWTNTLCIDVDKLKDNEDALRVKAIIADHPSCSAAFISPSGNGIKALLNVGALVGSHRTEKVAYFKTIFRKVAFNFLQEYQITLDKQCSNLNRLCFLSYDKDVYINEDAEEMDIAEMHDPDDNARCFADIDAKPAPAGGAGGSNKNYPKLTPDEVRSMLEYVPHTDYSRWLQVGMGLKEWDQFLGLELWDSWSQGDLKAWADGECAIKWETFSRHSITLATVRAIAQKNGWAKEPEPELGEDDEIVNEINKNNALVVMGNKVVVAKKHSNGGYSFLSVQSFNSLLENEYKTVISDSGKPKQIPHSRIWMSNANRRTYSNGIGFVPEQNLGEHKLNMWTGFGYERIPYDMKIIKPFIDYISGLAANEEERAYIMGWIARGFQKPHLPAEVALVLRGDKGVGKGTLGKVMCRLWGNHSLTITSAIHLTGNFNAHFDNKAFMVSDEALYHGDKKGEAVLKALITEPTMVIERKGFDVIQNKNCMKLIINANDEWVIPSSRDERRFFCLHVVEKFDTKTAKDQLFNHVYKLHDDKRAMGMFLDYLLSYDLTGFNHRAYPETVENNSQRALSMDVIPRYLIDICDRGAAQVPVISSYDARNGVTPMVWHNRVHTEMLMTGLMSWGKTNFKNGWEKPTKKQLTSYLEALGLRNMSFRGVAKRWTGTGTEILSKVSKGWDIGSQVELHGRVCEYQNVKGAIKFNGNSEILPELKTVDEWSEVDDL